MWEYQAFHASENFQNQNVFAKSREKRYEYEREAEESQSARRYKKIEIIVLAKIFPLVPDSANP